MFLRIIFSLGLLFVIAGCSDDADTAEKTSVAMVAETAVVADNSLSDSSEMATFHLIMIPGICTESTIDKSEYDVVMSFGAAIDGHCPKITQEGWKLESICRHRADKKGKIKAEAIYRVPNSANRFESLKEDCLSQEGNEWTAFE